MGETKKLELLGRVHVQPATQDAVRAGEWIGIIPFGTATEDAVCAKNWMGIIPFGTSDEKNIENQMITASAKRRSKGSCVRTAMNYSVGAPDRAC